LAPIVFLRVWLGRVQPNQANRRSGYLTVYLLGKRERPAESATASKADSLQNWLRTNC